MGRILQIRQEGVQENVITVTTETDAIHPTQDYRVE